MRRLSLVLSLLLLAAPSAAWAEGGVVPPSGSGEAAAPSIVLQRTTSVSTAPAVRRIRARVTPAPQRADQSEGPKSRNWWYLVGAIVAAGVILAIIL